MKSVSRATWTVARVSVTEKTTGGGIGVLLVVKFRPARAARDDSTLNMKR